MGDPPGDIAIYPKNLPEAVITADCIKFRIEERLILREFAVISMRSKYFQNQIRGITAGVAQQKVNLKKFRELNMLITSIYEQKEIVRRVESLFTLADTVEKQYLDAKKRTDKLIQSILAKAFKGELVPQDSNDGPADKLLARIKTLRGQENKKRATKKKASKQ